MKFPTHSKTGLKLTIIGATALLAAMFFIFDFSQKVEAYSGGPPASYSGAPGETNCTECHFSFPVNSGTGSVQITGIPHDYIPSHQYQVTVKTSQQNAVYWGFEMTSIDRLGQRAGTFSFPVITTPVMQIETGIVGGNSRDYIEQTGDGLYTNGVFDFNSWTFTWTAPAQRIGQIGFYAAGNGADGTGGPGNDYIYTTSRASLSGTATSNFDGDVSSDLAFFRPSTGTWSSRSAINNATQTYSLGGRGDKIVPGDYDGDGKTDFAVYRPSTSTWMIQQSTLGYIQTQFGNIGDIPIPGDYDGDGKTDLAVFRPSNSTWYLSQTTAGATSYVWGQTGDKLTPGDYDGDGKTDSAVFRPSNGTWYLRRSTAGNTQIQYGASVDKPVQADYDGDGKTDLAYFHPADGSWHLNRSTDGITSITPLGSSSTDILVPGDYDGDGKADIAWYVPRVSGSIWNIRQSTSGLTFTTTFGLTRDTPVPSAYIPQ